MKYLAWVFLLLLFLFPQTIGTPNIDRYELAGNISLIITYPSSNYTILSLVNNNNFIVTVVENIWINFTQDIDPGLVYAVDNYNQNIVPNEINLHSILFTYNNTLPALGYGKIFLDLTKPGPTPPDHSNETSPLSSTPSPTPTISLSPPPPNPTSPASTPTPKITTSSPNATSTPLFDFNETSINTSIEVTEGPPAELDEKPQESNLALITIGILIVIILALTVSVLIS